MEWFVWQEVKKGSDPMQCRTCCPKLHPLKRYTTGYVSPVPLEVTLKTGFDDQVQTRFSYFVTRHVLHPQNKNSFDLTQIYCLCLESPEYIVRVPVVIKDSLYAPVMVGRARHRQETDQTTAERVEFKLNPTTFQGVVVGPSLYISVDLSFLKLRRWLQNSACVSK
jgi:hypothetical protein